MILRDTALHKLLNIKLQSSTIIKSKVLSTKTPTQSKPKAYWIKADAKNI